MVRLLYNHGKIVTVNVCRIVLNSVVILTSLSVVGQPTLLQRYDDLDNAISRVEVLELEYGQNSFALAEPLAELADLYSEHGRYDDAYRALDRATLIIRRDRGLYTREQIPFLQQKIENFAASLGAIPRYIDIDIVAPDLDIPGIIARACASPIAIDEVKECCF